MAQSQVLGDDENVIIPPKSSTLVEVRQGQRLRIIDVEGAQIADLVCIDANDHSHVFSQSKTRHNNGRVRITTGDHLYSNRNEKMFSIAEDKVGVHDLLYPPCSSYLFETIFGVGPRDGCAENLASALSDLGYTPDTVPEPFNVFMNTTIDDNDGMVISRAVSKPGDHIDLVAELDLIVAVTSCAEDVLDGNAGQCTPIELRIGPAS